MNRRSVPLSGFIVTVVFAAIVSVPSGNRSAIATESPVECATGSGLVVLVGQEDLYLNRPGRRGSMGDSVLKSIVASALTGGSYLIGFSPGYDPGSLVAAPRALAAEYQAAAVAESLSREISLTPVAFGAEILAPTTRGEVVDEILWNTSCTKVVVVNAQYALERSREGVQLSLVAQVLDAPARRPGGESSTIAALEYRSSSLPFAASANAAEIAAELDRLLVEQRAPIESYFKQGSVEIAGMVARMLQPLATHASSAPLGKTVRQLVCDDCERSDRVISTAPGRLWIQPADQPLVVRSLPLRP